MRVTRPCVGVLTLLLACPAWSQEGGASASPEAQAATTGATPEVVSAPLASSLEGYRDPETVGALLDEWASAGGEFVESFDVATSRGGRPVRGLSFGAAGPVALDQRSTVFLVGGLDGISIAGTEGVLRATAGLLNELEDLRGDVAYLAIPVASPDGLVRAHLGVARDGKNDRPVDDDSDGVLAEDPPDDLDGDGYVLDMLVEDANGAVALSRDARFAVPAEPGDAPRYRLVREGRDDDDDGAFNEDAVGGVVLDLNFPIGWPGERADAGELPLSEPVARTLADLALERRTVLWLAFQGNHGLLAHAGDGTGANGKVYAAATAVFRDVTGRPQGSHQSLESAARGAGSAVEWAHAVLGIPAFELAPWGAPGRMRGGTPGDAQGENRTRDRRDPASRASASPLPPELLEWVGWLDEVRGGMGFVPWQPVEVPGLGRALVGGWEPRTYFNPPESDLESALSGIPEFVRRLTDGLPQLALRASATREGELVRLTARVDNVGRLPTGLFSAGRAPDRPDGTLLLELALPNGARLLAGPERRTLPGLAGQGATAPLEWLVLAPEGAALRLEVSSAWCAAVVWEGRP